MSAAPQATAVNCTQCGGELHPDQGQVFLVCPFCSSTVYLDKKSVVLHQYLAPTLDKEAARAHLSAWMSGNETVKNLDMKARIQAFDFAFFPVWFFKTRDQAGDERLYIQPAAATAVLEIKRLTIAAGDLRRFDAHEVQGAVEPTVPLEAARAWLDEEHPDAETVLETALVHLPVFMVRYAYDGREYSALIEAGTGSVLAGLFPQKNEAPYQAIANLAIGGYLVLSVLPIISALVAADSFDGFMIGIGLYLAIGAAYFVLCMVIAGLVASRF